MERIPVTLTLLTETPEERITQREEGILIREAGGLRLSYTEKKEEGEATRTSLVYREGALSLVRTGAVHFSTRFALGEAVSSTYRVGGMAFSAKTETEALSLQEKDGTLTLAWAYRLTLGGEARRIAVTLTAKRREADA